MENFLSKLNEAQLRPVIDTEGHLLVIAGAGSGKTRVLTTRIAYLINELRVSQENVLAITFTNKATNEMRERLDSMVVGAENIWVSTIHSMGVKILRSKIAVLGYTPNFTIYDDTDKDRVIKRILTDMEAEDKELKVAKMHISNAKNDYLTPDEYFYKNSTIPNMRMYRDIYVEYERALRNANALDFDDILVKTYQILVDFPEILEEYAKRFRYVHVDEFQDTNTIQYRIIQLLASYHNNLFVVGDDDQSIYSWRGANVGNMLNFDKDYKDAKVYKLQQNYRSTKKILNLANYIIKNNRTRRAKELWTENDEGDGISFHIADDEVGEAEYAATVIKSFMYSRRYNLSDIAVLMRVNALSRAYEQAFAKYNIPFKVYGGFKFFERKEIKDITAYLKLVNNPLDNEALLRVINYPKRGIGEKTVNTMRKYANDNALSLYDAVIDIDNLPLTNGIKNKISEFGVLIRDLIVKKETLTLTDFVKAVIEDTGISNEYAVENIENRDKRMNIDELVNSVMEFEKINVGAGLGDYLSSITLSADSDDINTDDCVTIATVHAVKGLEFKCVFVCGLDELLFPLIRMDSTPDEIEEERRLMYVAITRACEKLYLTRARSRFLYGERKFMTQSQFIKEMAEPLGLRSAKVVYQSPNRDAAFNENMGRAYNENQNESSYSSDYAKELLKKLSSGVSIKNTETGIFKVAQKVKHPKFGVGTIINIKGEGENKIADVAFSGVGIKSLALKFAPLEII